MSKVYILKENSIHDKFMALRTQLQFFGGGFGNGKTSAMVIKALQLAKDYPGSTGLMARSTYPKLNDTLRKVFIEFCPPEWIESFATSKNSDNSCFLKNGTQINFRYLAQRKGTEEGGSTSNLLSATYDWAVVDQIEDPEIIHKDFLDILGRLRGNTVYRGTDPTMPRTGPRWLMISSNPTRNWVFKKIVQPYHLYKKDGVVREGLLCVRDRKTKQPVLDADGKLRLLLDVVEGSTYENAHILEQDFIQLLESAYTGQMRDRYLDGSWASYEGLVYPEFSEGTHGVRHDRALLYLRDLALKGVRVKWLEGYDYGMASPACYILAFVDHLGNIVCIDGFYQKEFSISDQVNEIMKMRTRYGVVPSQIYADPSIMRRQASKLVGKTISDMFYDETRNIVFTPGNNDIINGITKVRQYLACHKYRRSPFDGAANAPSFYVSSKLTWIIDEFGGYMWQTDTSGERDDKPIDRNDHAMDTIKYFLSDQVAPGYYNPDEGKLPDYMSIWQEIDRDVDHNAYRH